MGEVIDDEKSSPWMERRQPAITPPPLQLHSPSMARSPLLDSVPKTPKSPFPTRLMTSLASPMKKATWKKLDTLPSLTVRTLGFPLITKSRNGNVYYSAFHTLSSGIGFQALVLPLAFTSVGWTWGIACLSLAFVWQLYTLWLLIQLHES